MKISSSNIRHSFAEVLESRIAPATIFVSNLNASGPGSLAQAVDDTNGTAEADIIKFDESLQGKITLASSIQITRDLKIDGDGRIILSGGETSQIFDVNDGNDSTFINVTLGKLGFVDGYKSTNGGAIQSKENLTLKNCALTGNESDTSGGAIYSTLGTLTLSKSTLIDNSSTGSGGALFVEDGNLNIVKSVINGNSSGNAGGGLHVKSAAGYTFSMSNSRVIGNEAAGVGGGVSVDCPTQTITSCVISGNTAVGSDVGGGGAYLDNDFAGGSNGVLAITNCKFSGNFALLDNGGGAYIDNGWKKVTIVGTTFEGNVAKEAGGLNMFGNSEAKITIKECSFVGNEALDGKAGGVHFKSDGSVKIISSIVTNNIATDGGGIAISSDAAVKMFGGLVSGNLARLDGGGIFAEGTVTPILSGVKVRGNFGLGDPNLSGGFTII